MLNKDNLNEIVENKDYYLNAVRKFNLLIRFEWAYNHKDFMDKLKAIYTSFKIVLPLNDRLNLKKLIEKPDKPNIKVIWKNDDCFHCGSTNTLTYSISNGLKSEIRCNECHQKSIY